MIAALATSAATFGAWLYLVAARGGFWRVRSEPPLRGPCDRPIAVIIPARDEAEHVGAAVRSVAGQDYGGPVDIVVVDDHSSDGTGRIAQQAAENVTVLSSKPLPDGWTGKMWAVAQGVEAASRTNPGYILLTDADVVHARHNLTDLVARAEGGGYDLVSYMVRLSTDSASARALMPAFVFFFLKLYPPAWIADPRAHAAGAAGGCMLIRRTTLGRIGGITSIRGEVIDDCALAARVKDSGGRIWMGLTTETYSSRSNARVSDVWRMISRTAFTQLGHSATLLAGTVLAMSLLYVSPVVLLFAGPPLARLLSAGALALMFTAFTPMLRLYCVPVAYALTLPAVAVFYTGATIYSAVRYWTGTGGMWKGRAQDRPVRV